MTKVDFYILSDSAPDKRLRTACRVAEKAYTQGLATHIHTDSEDDSRKIDELLWTFHDRSFIPHTLGITQADQREVTIAHGEIPQRCDVLINLAAGVPAFFSRFERVAEIIDQDAATRDTGRERYRFYRDRGYSLTHHSL